MKVGIPIFVGGGNANERRTANGKQQINTDRIHKANKL